MAHCGCQCAASTVAAQLADVGPGGPFQREVLQCDVCGPLAENMFLKNHNNFLYVIVLLDILHISKDI